MLTLLRLTRGKPQFWFCRYLGYVAARYGKCVVRLKRIVPTARQAQRFAACMSHRPQLCSGGPDGWPRIRQECEGFLARCLGPLQRPLQHHWGNWAACAVGQNIPQSSLCIAWCLVPCAVRQPTARSWHRAAVLALADQASQISVKPGQATHI